MNSLLFLAFSLSLQLPEDPGQLQDAGGAHFKFAQIRVPVWVNDRHHRSVLNLKKGHFKLFVDEKTVEPNYFSTSFEQEVDILFLLDLSGSMALGGKLEASKQVLTYLIRSLRSKDRWQLIVFAEKQVLKVLDNEHREQLEGTLAKARAYGKTALYDALLKAPAYLQNRGTEQKAVFLFTDGHDNNSTLDLEATRYLMKNLTVPLFAIGIMDGFLPSQEASEEPLNVNTLKTLTTAGGGELLLARDRSDLLDMKNMLRENLRAHYILGFMVERGEGETRHQIRVKTKKRLHIRYRKSYIGMPP